MKDKRLQKFILSFGIILSLFASSLAACACSHHSSAEAERHESSCHQNSHKTERAETGVNDDAENQFFSVSEKCGCFVKISQPFVVGKSENVKIQKSLTALPVQVKAESCEAISANETPKAFFEFHFYNSNYLRKLTPPRAPPVI